MGVRQPADISEAFGRSFNNRDKNALLALYTETAILTVDGSAVARGVAEIERMMTPFFEGPLRIAIKCSSCLQEVDIALVRSHWTLAAPDGAVAMTGSSAEILRKGTDGLWRLIIDDATFASRSSTP
jgi:uncharacterized protein (TIGR02246 family)